MKKHHHVIVILVSPYFIRKEGQTNLSTPFTPPVRFPKARHRLYSAPFTVRILYRLSEPGS